MDRNFGLAKTTTCLFLHHPEADNLSTDLLYCYKVLDN